jgi:hypothetical protein
MNITEPFIPMRWRAEPYRILFPLGILGAVIGMGIWIPHSIWAEVFAYPGQSHAMIQIRGFLLSFVFGFLGTMLPKVLGVPPLGSLQFLVFPLGLTGVIICSLADRLLEVQVLHLILLVNFAAFIAMRWRKRQGNPPVFFVFIAAAMAADMTGTALRIAGLSGYGTAQAFRLGALLQYQAFPLLLILGVGGFLLPKLFANEQIDPSRLQSAGTSKGMLLLAAILFLLGYGIEAWLPYHPLSIRAGSGLRAVIWGWFLFRVLSLHSIPATLPAWLAAARLSLLFIGLGLALPVLWPAYLLAWEHVIFIGGILWLTITVATRVITAHGGRLEVLLEHRKVVLAYGWLLVFAVIIRGSAEFWLPLRGFQLGLASALALIALGLWTRLYGLLLFQFPGAKP